MIIEKRVKVPNGKLLIIKAHAKAGKISEVKIFGDFFFYPEEKLHLFEKALSENKLDDIPDALKKIIDENKIELVGVTVESICELMKAVYDEIEKPLK